MWEVSGRERHDALVALIARATCAGKVATPRQESGWESLTVAVEHEPYATGSENRYDSVVDERNYEKCEDQMAA